MRMSGQSVGMGCNLVTVLIRRRLHPRLRAKATITPYYYYLL
jgi:hypothetical protein